MTVNNGRSEQKINRLLPEGWTSTKLETIADSLTYGYTASAKAGLDGPRFLRITDIQNGTVHWNSVPTCTIEENDIRKYGLCFGDIVFARTGATTGKSFLIQSCPPAVFASYLIRLRLLPGINTALLAHFFQTSDYWRFISDNVAGIAQPNCNATKLAELEIPIPPAAEQQRLVKAIGAALLRVSSARDHLSRIPAILKRFRQAVLAAACSGRLTEDWRLCHKPASPDRFLQTILSKRAEQPKEKNSGVAEECTATDLSQVSELPDEWATTNVDQLSCLVTSGSRGWAKYYTQTGALFIRAQDINTDQLKTNDVAHVQPPNSAEGKRTRVYVGDLLVTITGANVTKAALVNREMGESYVSQHVALVRLVDPTVAPFLYLWIVSPAHGRAKLLEDAYGAGKPGLNLDNIRTTTVALPSPDEQIEIVHRVKILFSAADVIEKQTNKAQWASEKLIQSILAKAFRGELVPSEAELARREGRDYEHASVLLERIRAEKTNLSKPQSPKHKLQKPPGRRVTS